MSPAAVISPMDWPTFMEARVGDPFFAEFAQHAAAVSAGVDLEHSREAGRGELQLQRPVKRVLRPLTMLGVGL